MAERQSEYFPVHFSLIFEHTHAIPYHKTMAKISEILYEVCSRDTYLFRNNFNVVYLVTSKVKFTL
jgi:hypothetical protein